MSLFGEHLRNIVDSHNINIYALAKSAGIERTVIHKIMSVGRIPSDQTVQKLADALPLSPDERRTFLENFNISKIGKYRHNQRLQVKNIIESIAHIENGVSIATGFDINGTIGKSPLNGATNTTATGSFAVNNLVKAVLEDTIACEAEPAVDCVIPGNYQYFYNELLAIYLRFPQMQIKHILAFTKRTDMLKTETENENLKILSQTLPFAFAPGTGYSLSYYYKHSTEPEVTSLMPYFILTSANKLLLIGKDFDNAVLICDESIVKMYRGMFSTMLDDTYPLIKRLNSTMEFFASLLNSVSEIDITKNTLHCIEGQPCFLPLASNEFFDKHIKKDIPNRDMTLELITACYGMDLYGASAQNQNINVCTIDGLNDIIETGYVSLAFREIILPMSRDTIKEMLTILQNKITENKIKLLFNNPSKMILPTKTRIQINRTSGIALYILDTIGSDYRFLTLSEDSVNEAFADFVESIEDSGLVDNKMISLATLERTINEI